MTHALIEHLRELRRRDDRGALAALRAGLADEPRYRVAMHPHVLPFLAGRTSRWQEDSAYAVAGLFAFHDSPELPDVSIGSAVRRLAERAGDRDPAVEARFSALLAAHVDDLFVHLRHIVSLLKSNEIAVDWERLLRELDHWDHPDAWVQRRWAHDFWAASDAGTDDLETEPKETQP